MLESEYGYIKDAEDWAHYCARIDDMGRPFDMSRSKKREPYFFQHEGEPLEYPCLVQSNFADDPNGPYLQYHSFVYLSDAARLVHMSLTDLMAERDRYKKLYETLLETLNEKASSPRS